MRLSSLVLAVLLLTPAVFTQDTIVSVSFYEADIPQPMPDVVATLTSEQGVGLVFLDNEGAPVYVRQAGRFLAVGHVHNAVVRFDLAPLPIVVDGTHVVLTLSTFDQNGRMGLIGVAVLEMGEVQEATVDPPPTPGPTPAAPGGAGTQGGNGGYAGFTFKCNRNPACRVRITLLDGTAVPPFTINKDETISVAAAPILFVICGCD